jgi:trigger factor
MKVEINNLPRSQVEISVEISVAEMQPYLAKAAQKISEVKKIPGFRPGKASLEAVKNQVGEEALWSEAAQAALPVYLTKAIKQEKLAVIGEPYYDMDKIKPNAKLNFKATMSLLPEVTLGDYKSKKVKVTKTEVTPDKVGRAMEEIVKMRRSEALVNRAAQMGDKVEIDLDITRDGTQIDRQEKMPVVLGDKGFIKGFEEVIVGMTKEEVKEIDLSFPKEYYNKNLAGQKAHFKIKLLNVYELKTPKLDDDLAKSIGNFQSVADLRKHLEQNLENEANNMYLRQQEDELMKQLIDSAKFGDIPEVLVNEEVKKLIHEMQHTLTSQGISMADHLKQLGKKESELALELTPRALERVKASLVLRQVVHDEKIVVSEDEYKAELDKLKKTYQDSEDMLKQIESAQHREYLGSSLLYKKVIDYLKSKMVEG